MTRINERIRVPEVRLIDDEGNQVGVLKTPDALVFAQEREMDLVEVAPEARPPVVRVLDYSKYKYEQAQKQKAARKHQQQITVREIKFRPKIAEHDYDTKKNHVERFLRHKDKVKVTIMFRGREVTHPERGTAILDRLATELSELGVVEQRPMQEGRNMTMLMAPSKAVLAGRVGAEGAELPVPASPNGGPTAPDGDAVATNAAAEVVEEPAAEAPAADAPAAEVVEELAAEVVEELAAEAAEETLAEAGQETAPEPAGAAQASPESVPEPGPASRRAPRAAKPVA